MKRIPLSQRLDTNDTGRLISQFARLWCVDLFSMWGRLLSDDSYIEQGQRTHGYQLAPMVSHASDLPPDAKDSMLYHILAAPFAQMKKGEIDHE